MKTKQCTKCGETKPVTDFYRVRGNDGYRSHCKECILQHQKQRYNTDPAYKENKNQKVRHKWTTDPELWAKRQLAVRKSHLKRKYGMTLEQYAQMFNEQKNVVLYVENITLTSHTNNSWSIIATQQERYDNYFVICAIQHSVNLKTVQNCLKKRRIM